MASLREGQLTGVLTKVSSTAGNSFLSKAWASGVAASRSQTCLWDLCPSSVSSLFSPYGSQLSSQEGLLHRELQQLNSLPCHISIPDASIVVGPGWAYHGA